MGRAMAGMKTPLKMWRTEAVRGQERVTEAAREALRCVALVAVWALPRHHVQPKGRGQVHTERPQRQHPVCLPCLQTQSGESKRPATGATRTETASRQEMAARARLAGNSPCEHLHA